jgi:hypothetical protein
MKKLITVLFITSFLACTTVKEKSELPIFNNISFKLMEGESLMDLTPEIKDNYLSYFKNTNLQIPLFKSFKAEDYTIYIGIPYNTSIEKLIELQIVDQTANPIILESDNSSYFFKKQNTDTTYISEYSMLFDKNLIYILAITDSKTISDSLLNQIELSNRFNQK